MKASTQISAANQWLLSGLVAATFLSLLHYLAFSPLLPTIAADLHVAVGEIGQLPAAIGLGAAMVGLVAGPLADRYGKRRTLLIGLCSLVASATMFALITDLTWLPLIAVLSAIGRATVYPLALAIATAQDEAEAQRRAASRITSSLGAAPIVGVPLVSAVAAAFDWRLAWLALAVITACAAVGLRNILRTGGRGVAQPQSPAPHVLKAYLPLLRHAPSLALLGGTFTMGAAGWAVWTYLGAFAVQRYGFSTTEAGWAWTVVGVGLLLGTLLMGGPLGRHRLDVVFPVAALGTGVCFLVALVVPMWAWGAVGLVAVGTLLHGTTQVMTAIWLPQSAPTGRAATMTVRGAASSLGSAAGAAVGGLILQGGGGFEAVGMCAAAFALLAAALSWLQAAVSVRLNWARMLSSTTHAATWAREDTPSLSKMC